MSLHMALAKHHGLFGFTEMLTLCTKVLSEALAFRGHLQIVHIPETEGWWQVYQKCSLSMYNDVYLQSQHLDTWDRRSPDLSIKTLSLEGEEYSLDYKYSFSWSVPYPATCEGNVPD